MARLACILDFEKVRTRAGLKDPALILQIHTEPGKADDRLQGDVTWQMLQGHLQFVLPESQ